MAAALPRIDALGLRAMRLDASALALPPLASIVPGHTQPSIRIKGRIASSSNGSSPEEDKIWQNGAFPQYLQQSPSSADFCSDWEAALAQRERQQGSVPPLEHGSSSAVWRTVLREAEQDARAEPLLSSFLYASVLSHETFERSLAFVLANRLSDATLLPTELFEVFYTVLRSDRSIADAALADLCAVRERDPACCSYAQALLHFKGYHALQTQRIAHHLWHAGRRFMAVALQSRASEVFAVDIHPAAKLGRGVLLDHGTGVVIGQTAEVGNNVSILQNVTLGGTGKQHGDRHPKVSDNVLIGASATILGNIRIGKGAQVAAGSLVLKPVPPRTMVAGSPAKEVGTVSGNPASQMEHWGQLARRGQVEEEPCDDPFLPGARSEAGAASAELSHNGKEAAEEDRPPQREEGSLAAGASAQPAEAVEAPQAEAEAAAAVGEEAAAEPVEVGPALASAQSKRRGPPTALGPVDAVTSDLAARKKWGSAKDSDMEYLI